MAHIVHARRLAALGAAAALAASIVGGSVARAGTTVPADDGAEAVVATFPLTGLPVPEGVEPRAVIAVKVDNAPPARPQSGLNQADIVFEEIVEGSITRFAAVFNSTSADVVGPVRSGRTQDVGLLSLFERPVLAYSGANPGVQAALRDTDFTLVTEGNSAFFRDNPRRVSREHTLWLHLDELFAQVSDNPAPAPQFEHLADGDSEPGVPASSVEVQLGSITVRWDWDADASAWLRTQNGREHDVNDGRVSTDNIVALMVPYGRSAADSRSPEAQVTGGGPAVVFRNGERIDGEWHRDNYEEPFRLTTADGMPLKLTPGRAWVELVDANNGSLTSA